MKTPTMLPKTTVSRRILTNEARGLIGEGLIPVPIGIPQHTPSNRR